MTEIPAQKQKIDKKLVFEYWNDLIKWGSKYILEHNPSNKINCTLFFITVFLQEYMLVTWLKFIMTMDEAI